MNAEGQTFAGDSAAGAGPGPIARPDDLKPLLEAVCASPEIYIDTEADSLHHYFEKICLLQFTLPGDRHFLVDPLAGLDLGPLFESLKGKLLVLHGADYDLRMLRMNFDFRPDAIFDTMLAARLAGHSSLGLDALVERYRGQRLDQGAQKADWSQRPLPPRLLKYAVEDTCYLPSIAEKLREELSSLGRVEWHRQQCRQLIESSAVVRTKSADEVWRIKGSFHLDRQSLAILRELWNWRDEQARHWDRPPYMVCNNEKLIELANWAKGQPGASLSDGPELPRRWPSHRARSLVKALQKAWSLSEADWPLPAPRGKRAPYDPNFSPRFQGLRQVRDAIAKELQLDPSILANNASLEAIASRTPKNLDDFQSIEKWLPWQTDLLGQAFLKSLCSPTGASERV